MSCAGRGFSDIKSLVQSSRTEITVRYAETDQMGVAHHSSYLPWFELGRTGLLREAGHAYRDMEKKGYLLPVVEYACRMRVGAEYDDLLTIETVVERLRSRTLTFSYRVFRDATLLATGWTKHLCVDPDNNIRRLPKDIT